MMIINTHIVMIIMTTIIRIMACTKQQLFSTYSTCQIPSPTSQSLPLPPSLLPIPLSITTTPYSLFYIYHIFQFIIECWSRSQNFEKRPLASPSLSLRPHGETRLPLDGFLRNLIFGYFSKICRESSTFIKMSQD
jgi:hypothetical protein